MLSKSFKPGKCKTALKLAIARIKLLKNKREVQLRLSRRELSQLLEAGQEQTARIRVEHVLREEKTISAYELIEIYCELIVARLPIIESQKSCPIDLKEAITSVVFASPRCADIPELMDVRKQFVAKYGKEFVTSALELRPECGVNRMMVEKLSAKAPDIEIKIKSLIAIAQEHNIKWDSKAFEEQLHKPSADLLNGPSTFSNTAMVPPESSEAKLVPASNQKIEPPMKLFQNNLTSRPATMDNSSHSNINTSSTSVSSTSQHDTRAPDSRSVREAKNAHAHQESTSADRPRWNMEFKDAASAAQAAAESAEMASMAARAAAELASHGKFSPRSSTRSHRSSRTDIKNDRPEQSKGPRLEGEYIVHERVAKEDDELKRSQTMKPEAENFPRDEAVQVTPRRGTESIHDDLTNSSNRSSNVAPSRSGTTSDDLPDDNFQKADSYMEAFDHYQRSFPEVESVEQDFKNKRNENIESSQWNKNAVSPHFTGNASDENTTWNSNLQEHEDNDGDDSVTDAGDGSFRSEQKFPTFDDYVSDTDDIFGRKREGNLLDSYAQEEPSSFSYMQEEPSSFSYDVDHLSPKFHSTGSLVKEGSFSVHSMKEPHSMDHSETREDVLFPSQPDEHLLATFDDSDGLSSESEGEMANSTIEETSKRNSLLHNQISSTRGSISEGSTSDFPSHLSSSGYENNRKPDGKSSDELWKQTGSVGFHNNQPSSTNEKPPPINLVNLERESSYYLPDEPQSWQTSNVSATEKPEIKGTFGMASSPPDTKDVEISNEVSSELGQGFNLGRLTGGFKNKGYSRPPYVRRPSIKASVPSQVDTKTSFTENQGKPFERSDRDEDSVPSVKSAEVNPGINERPVTYHQDNTSEDLETAGPESYKRRQQKKDVIESSSNPSAKNPQLTVRSRRSRDGTSTPSKQSMDAFSISNEAMVSSEVPKVKAPYKEFSSRIPITYSEFDDGDDEPEESNRGRTAASVADKDTIRLSRRTRTPALEPKRESHLRSSGRSDSTVNKERVTKASESIRPASSEHHTSETPTNSKSLAHKGDQKPTMPAVPANNEAPSASKASTSRESSLKSASHLHPKLPDYETFAAHFHSLRSNRH